MPCLFTRKYIHIERESERERMRVIGGERERVRIGETLLTSNQFEIEFRCVISINYLLKIKHLNDFWLNNVKLPINKSTQMKNSHKSLTSQQKVSWFSPTRVVNEWMLNSLNSFMFNWVRIPIIRIKLQALTDCIILVHHKVYIFQCATP